MNKESGVGGAPACASCKHQRKKCDDTCELAPYFPASKWQDFQSAHKLFGVSNIIKILNTVEPPKRHAAAESIIEEAKIRKDDPVHGCLGVIQKLSSQIELCQKELDTATKKLAFCREKVALQQQQCQLRTMWAKSSTPSTMLPTLKHLSTTCSSSSIPCQKLQLNQIRELHQAPILRGIPGEVLYMDDVYNHQTTLEKRKLSNAMISRPWTLVHKEGDDV